MCVCEGGGCHRAAGLYSIHFHGPYLVSFKFFLAALVGAGLCNTPAAVPVVFDVITCSDLQTI